MSSHQAAGKTRSILETGRYAQGVKVALPVLTVTGAHAGPLAVILACHHGRELNGIASIERVFARLDPDAVSGTVVFLPVLNPVGARIHGQDYPTEKMRYRKTGAGQIMDIHRAYGEESAASTYAAAIAEAVWEAYVRRAELCIDLHGWSGLSLCLAWALQRDVALLRAFGLPWHQVTQQLPETGTTAEVIAQRHGIPWITCELVPQNMICNESVGFGERGVLNALKYAGLLQGAPELPPVQYEFDDSHVETVIRTTAEGLVVSDFSKGDWLRQGQTALRVLSLDTLETAFAFQAPHDALLFNLGGTNWGEDIPESAVVFPGQVVGLLKKPDRILTN